VVFYTDNLRAYAITPWHEITAAFALDTCIL
jgi:hypothetical protein